MHILGILGYILGITQVYLRFISGEYPVYNRYFMHKLGILGYILGISQVYLRHKTGISQVYLKYI